MRTLVALPTYDEAENIVDVLTRIRAAVPDADVLVVDDGSPDGTADIAEYAGVELGHVTVMRRPGKAGLGSAYRDAFRRGLADGYDAFVEMDADLSHDPAALPSLLAPLHDGAALVVGSRYVPGGAIPDWSPLRRFISVSGNRYARVLLGVSLHDATAGYRAYSRAALESIDLDRVRADGYGFQVEMAYRVERAGGRLVEVPIVFRDRALGKSKMSGRIVVEALALVTLWGVRDRCRAMWGRLTRRHAGGRGAAPGA